MDNTSLHCFIISYDLCTPDRSYDDLFSVLRSFTSWGRLTESSWAVVTSESYVEVRDKIWRVMGGNDRLIVIQSGRSAAWSNVLANDEWVKQNIVL